MDMAYGTAPRLRRRARRSRGGAPWPGRTIDSVEPWQFSPLADTTPRAENSPVDEQSISLVAHAVIDGQCLPRSRRACTRPRVSVHKCWEQLVHQRGLRSCSQALPCQRTARSHQACSCYSHAALWAIPFRCWYPATFRRLRSPTVWLNDPNCLLQCSGGTSWASSRADGCNATSRSGWCFVRRCAVGRSRRAATSSSSRRAGTCFRDRGDASSS